MFKFNKHDKVNSSDEELMLQLTDGDRQAFETLYDRYFNKLVWFAKGFVDETNRAEDLVQDVFIKVIENPDLFDQSKKFSTWIYVVTSNRCKQVLRDEKNRLRILQENVFPYVEKTSRFMGFSDFNLLKEKIQKVYINFTEKEKNIYTLRFEQELSIKEIAEILELPEGSIKSGIYYLLKKLAHHLKDFTHEY
ncbi:hypothetical protein CNR22_21095 [Sphingobacteriaceae bacterium]|nr:hypothetical protein CNR22_21095 [Sphingobacteriaceae bacterium]